jgi:hypothetical protein
VCVCECECVIFQASRPWSNESTRDYGDGQSQPLICADDMCLACLHVTSNDHHCCLCLSSELYRYSSERDMSPCLTSYSQSCLNYASSNCCSRVVVYLLVVDSIEYHSSVRITYTLKCTCTHCMYTDSQPCATRTKGPFSHHHSLQHAHHHSVWRVLGESLGES